jgi:hypothetical protein
MQWKYFFPDPWTSPTARVAFEDVHLISPQPKGGRSLFVLTIEGLRSFTGGTRDEKLELLGSAGYHISDAMEMLVRQDDFNMAEMLEWIRVFIRARLGDNDPLLVEATDQDRADHTSTPT